MAGFGFKNFANVSALTLNNDCVRSGNRLRVSTDTIQSKGSAFLTTPVSLPANGGFSTVFSYSITNSGPPEEQGGADGLFFVLHDGPATEIGGLGGSIGYYDTGGIRNSVAIGVDTFENSGAPDNDLDGNHLEVGTAGTRPADAEAAVATDFNDGSTNWMWIDYDGTDLSVYHAETSTKPAVADITHTVDLVAEWGTTTVFPGFTSSGFNGFGDHDVRSWDMQWANQTQGLPQVFVAE